MKYLLPSIISVFLILASCEGLSPKTEAEQIIYDCIDIHGGKAYNQARFIYDFRDKTYVFDYNRGQYQYERLFVHETGNTVRDVLTNSKFERFIDGKFVQLNEEKLNAYSNSVNSVHYFAFLPFFLKDKSVQSELIGSEEINSQPYHKIKVTFEEEGGGDDHEDVYIYWIHQDSKTMDYLAYSYNQPDDKGVRFRSAYNAREIGGIRFQDYVNYKHEEDTPVETLGDLYNRGQLTELSRIELRNIRELERE